MKPCNVKINASLFDNRLTLKVNIDGDITIREKRLAYEDKINIDNMLFYWVLNTIKPVFFRMPLGDAAIHYNKAVENTGVKKLLQFCHDLLVKTNQLITQYSTLKGAATGNDGLLLYNCDSSHFYTNFFRYFQEADKDRSFYLNMKTGFDPLKRQWGEPEFPMTLDELIQFILKNKIKRVLSPNHYMIEHYFGKKHLYLLALFHFIGVEFIVVDNDNGDVSPEGYLIKDFFNFKEFKRLSFGFMMRNWFGKLRFDNAQITPTAAEYSIDAPYNITDEYQVLVLSNSRAGEIPRVINPLLYVMGQLDQNNLYEEFHMWFHSLRHLILDVMELPSFERFQYGSSLFRFFYLGLQYLKFVIVDSISRDYTVRVYGDEGWGKVLPEQYQNKWLNKDQIKAEIATNRNILLPFNFTHAWPTTPGPLLTAISYNIPFLSMPAMVHSKEFEGFKKIEYRNADDINAAIKNIKAIFQDPELINSIRFYKKIVSDNLTTLSDQLLHLEKDQAPFEDEYIRQFHINYQMVEDKVKAYVETHDEFLRDTFRVVIQQKPLTKSVNLSDFTLFHKGYTQRILKMANP